MRITTTNVRVGITGALLFLFLGVLQGCSEAITAPDQANGDDNCILINGTLHCKD
jgi:hypothetical protein